MTNERKLELTLCGMLPYDLQILDFYGDIKFCNLYNFEIYDLKKVKPLLHSLDKLTEPILDGGLIPIYELCKMQGFSMPNISECEFSFHNDYNSQTAMVKMDGWVFRYLGGGEKSFWLNGTAEWNKKHQKSVRQMLMFEKLKEWHFNIYDLPSDMYIEKSTVKI